MGRYISRALQDNINRVTKEKNKESLKWCGHISSY